MLENINFKLNNCGAIGNSDMKLGKINVIAGLNSTGKSTSSKLLYSFLRANSRTRREIAEPDLFKKVFEFALELYSFCRPAWVENDEENCGKILEKLEEIIEINDNEDNGNRRKKGEIKINLKNMDLFNKFNSLQEIYKNEYNIKEDYRKLIDKSYSSVEELINIYDEDGDELFQTVLNLLIKREFGKNTSELNSVDFLGKFNKDNFNYGFNIKEGTYNNLDGWFKIEDVFYLDSFSIFDGMSNGGSQNTEHINHIFHSLGSEDDESIEWADEIEHKKIINIMIQIMQITDGTFVYDDKNIVFNAHNQEFLMKNTASGIKQIGIIQMLLDKRRLKENCFLIIDEPEVNLHPKWQLDYAEILTLLAKELNITLYINSHSPLFIEAIRTFAEKYYLLDETNFYLTCPSDNIDGKYDIKFIDKEDLSIIYSTLGDPYEKLSDISIDNEFR